MPNPPPTTPLRTLPAQARILIIRPRALGDVCRSVPVLASLKAALPTARIDWLVHDAFAPAITAHPALSEAVYFQRHDLSKWYGLRGARASLKFLASLRERHYDAVIDAQGLARSGVFAFATRAPIRIGYANARELGWLGCNVRIRVPKGMHAVDRMLQLLRPLGVPPIHDLRLYAPPADVEALARDHRLSGPFAVLAPGSRWPGKRWPADRFAQVAQSLLNDNRVAHIAIVGSRAERAACTPLLALAAKDPRIIDLMGTTTVGGLMALIARAAIVIANDSAALHMAVGFNRPLVALYGPTDIRRVGPYQRDAWVIQHTKTGEALDHKDEAAGTAMMARITTDEVLTLANRAMTSIT